MYNLIGKKFDRLLVIEKQHDNKKRVVWKCKCDCGNHTVLHTSHLTKNLTRSCGCLYKECQRGEKSHRWKGGRYVRNNGYILLSNKHDHPNADEKGCILEHRYVMSRILKRPLYEDEQVHHKNGIKDDNRPENLELKVNNHGRGQSIDDIIKYSVDILKRYRPEVLEI